MPENDFLESMGETEYIGLSLTLAKYSVITSLAKLRASIYNTFGIENRVFLICKTEISRCSVFLA